jgi:hypothetical protein
LSELTILTIGVFVILFGVVIGWSPLARGLIRESVMHPNESCTLNETSDRHVTVDRGRLPPEKPQNTGGAKRGSKQVGAGQYFKFALAATFIITLLCLIALVALAFAHSSDQVTSVSGTCEKGFIFGFSALIGLIGGKSLN